ncbi:MAG TPA: hypothetical protein VK610_04095, partial [Rhodothermales bacterium]|nr:hypothetical protein [Rhodothermales bacterium]
DPPERTVSATLRIDALAPLSLVRDQPGSYYQSEAAPTEAMLYGLLENALGWHFAASDRNAILKALQKQAKKGHGKTSWAESPWLTERPARSSTDFESLLGFHLGFDGLRELPSVLAYDDLWARQLRDPEKSSFFGGSRHYDARLEGVITRARQQRVTFGDRKEHERLAPEALDALPEGAGIHYKSVRDRFPHYYVSPVARGYVVPLGPYRFGFSATPAVYDLMRAALEDPAAPMYLGSNDGWVEAAIEDAP